MTVHATKGLEFPVVAVADLGRGLGAGRGPALRLDLAADRDTGDGEAGGGEEGTQAMRVGLRLARLGKKQTPIFDYPALEQAAVGREREEERRILHVAMTRAERHLVLSGSFEVAKLGADAKDTDPLIAPVLRALGWDGQPAEIELEPPPLRPGLEGSIPPARVVVRTRTPGEDELEGASREASTASEQDRPERDLTPLPDPELARPASPAGPPVKGVSYSALAVYERCGYRFYAERVLGMRRRLPGAGPSGSDPGPDLASSDAADRPTDEWHPDGGVDDLVTRYARGRVVHELLERSAREGWAAPDREHAVALLRREGAAPGPGPAERALSLVRGFLESPLRMEVASAARIHPEAPFAFRTGGLLVRGEIDLLADLAGEVLVIDYKTDALDGSAPAEHLERYRLQRRIYALAALRRYGKAVRVAYVFLERPDDPVEERFEPEDAERLARELAATTGGIVGGRFEVTDAPERPLCLDCPARERLCVHGPELTMRDSAVA
ncbi:MAG TPA: PD-(D/E)XK nuclease family protein, partial [Thermoleophilaceae bacterium]|nr:PD-(D/E)XK nuclease family protein [Thermoleophilaceae bacterium]